MTWSTGKRIQTCSAKPRRQSAARPAKKYAKSSPGQSAETWTAARRWSHSSAAISARPRSWPSSWPTGATMTRTLTLALIALVLSAGLHAQEPRVVKQSPDGKNEIVPGDVFEANAAAVDATTTVTLVCEADVICNLEITVPEK